MLKQRSLGLLLGTTAFLFLFPFIVAASVSMNEAPTDLRPDILVIDIPSSPDHKDMPKVMFKHDLHTEAVEGQCIKCHDKKDDRFVFKFKRTEDTAENDFMDLYHENCVACHSEMKGKADATGPMEAECRVCHNANPKTGSSWTAINFDRSLHFTHEKAKTIRSGIKNEETNCNACHHSANMKAKTTFYEKGKESACVYCHKETAVDGIRSGRNAAHDSCVACHTTMAENNKDAGPVDCAGCHSLEKQKVIKANTDIPRLDRNQPDQALLTGWETLGQNDEENSKLIAQHMNAVPFDHKAHETANQSCKVCHHETLNKCVSCHTVKGEEKGGYVKLTDAMHKGSASQSCIGCHNEKKAAKECAGCHAQMPQKPTRDQDCASCHAVDVKSESAAVLNDDQAAGTLAKAAMDSRSYTKVNLADIPETVVINTIEAEYKPSELPHRKIVEAIFKKVENNTMATAFHKNDLTMCMGCHHNSPATMTPPKCASCHAKLPDTATGKPGLKGAYHGQCITCHQRMEVTSVLPTDCTKCHEKK
ncbi:MAG TPA: cytochrome C [Desulfobacteraceae bacterium]|nr:cytochrome C [Desulfobacteraceae bacterium]